MYLAGGAISIGGRDIPLEGIELIELHSSDCAEVQLRDGTTERLEGADASDLTKLLSTRSMPVHKG